MKIRSIIFAMLLCSIFVSHALAQRTIHMNIEDLVKHSGMIVHGTVTKIESGYDKVSRLTATWITIRVIENFYGASANEFTFKQYGGRQGKRIVKLPDMPQYRTGEEVILMLTSKSRIGMQSPVGMQQGKFRIQKERETGKKIAVNGLHNQRLFDGVELSTVKSKLKKVTSRQSAMSVNDFADVVRSIVKSVKTTGVK